MKLRKNQMISQKNFLFAREEIKKSPTKEDLSSYERRNKCFSITPQVQRLSDNYCK